MSPCGAGQREAVAPPADWTPGLKMKARIWATVPFMRLVAFGVGYVGLVTGTGLAELGHDVLCVDIDPERIRQLEDGVLPIYEPGLGDLVRRNERAGRLRFATDVLPPFDEADAYFV